MFHTRPSDLLAVSDRYGAYCVDDAVAFFGNMVESELARVDGKDNKQINQRRNLVLKKMLSEVGNTGQQFADPVAMGKVSSG